MDTSPVQSGSKCGSDFSIDRILSSDSRRSDTVDVPDWLCCTRYKPPRLPRAVSGGGGRSRRSGRHARVPFTAAQAAALEAAYARAPYLAPPALRALAAALQLRDDRIKIWFQNRRARERREKCATIAQPIAVTLSPTTSAHIAMISPCSWTISTRREMPSQRVHIRALEREGRIEMSSSYDKHRSTIPISLIEASSLNESTDDDRAETPLDIETFEE